MQVTQLDHLVLTVKDIDETVSFYVSVLGMERIEFAEDRVALRFGTQMINLHQAGNEREPKAQHPLPGSADLCFATDEDLDAAMEHVRKSGMRIIDGPVRRTGASGPVVSFYFRDPDMNLIEICSYRP
jgi:catechol 2,3-dioxygenase-like lactoylglutathione lyase family enzyme